MEGSGKKKKFFVSFKVALWPRAVVVAEPAAANAKAILGPGFIRFKAVKQIGIGDKIVLALCKAKDKGPPKEMQAATEPGEASSGQEQPAQPNLPVGAVLKMIPGNGLVLENVTPSAVTIKVSDCFQDCQCDGTPEG